MTARQVTWLLIQVGAVCGAAYAVMLLLLVGLPS